MSETKKTTMGRQQILDTIKNLAHSQGLYSRLYANLQNLRRDDPEQYDQYMNHLVNQQFSDPVDLVLYFEC